MVVSPPLPQSEYCEYDMRTHYSRPTTTLGRLLPSKRRSPFPDESPLLSRSLSHYLALLNCLPFPLSLSFSFFIFFLALFLSLLSLTSHSLSVQCE